MVSLIDTGPIITQVQNVLSFALGSALVAFVGVVVLWKKIKDFLCDINILVSDCRCKYHLTYQVTPAVQDSLVSCFETEPIMGLYGEGYQNMVSIEFRLEKGRKIRMEPVDGKVVVALPSRSMLGVVKGLDMHVQKNMASLLGNGYPPKLQRAFEVYVMKLIMTHCKLDGALRIAIDRFVSKMKQDKEVALLFDRVASVNTEMKKSLSGRPFADKNLLRILLLECCRAEFNAVGRVFV